MANDFYKTIGFIRPEEDKTIIGDDLSINVPHIVYRDIVIFKSTFNATFLTYVKELNESISSLNKKLIRFELNQEIDVVNYVGLLVNKEFVVNKIKTDFDIAIRQSGDFLLYFDSPEQYLTYMKVTVDQKKKYEIIKWHDNNRKLFSNNNNNI